LKLNALITALSLLDEGIVQGNCGASSNKSVLEDLEQSTAGRVEYPPLKPLQCVFLIDKPFLWRNNATMWLDSLYIAVSRTKVMSDFSILQYGSFQLSEGIPGRSMYITSSTFVGEGRGNAWMIANYEPSASYFIEGVISVSGHAFTKFRLGLEVFFLPCATFSMYTM
jgi:hypothetical protein